MNDATQQMEEVDSLLPLQFVGMGVVTMPQSHGRRKHLSPTPLVARNSSEIKVRSDQLTCRIRLGLLDEKKYTCQIDHDQAECTVRGCLLAGHPSSWQPKCTTRRKVVVTVNTVLSAETHCGRKRNNDTRGHHTTGKGARRGRAW